MTLTIGASQVLKENFHAVNKDNFFGFLDYHLDINIEEMLSRGRGKCDGAGFVMGDIFVKRLKTQERDITPPLRFQNSLSLYAMISRGILYQVDVPQPMGLIYDGKPSEFVLRKTPGYFLARNIPGRRLLSCIEDLTIKEREIILRNLGQLLERGRSKGVALMDFAPRDIVLQRLGNSKNEYLAIVDTENVIFNGCYSDQDIRGLVKQQKKQFIEDYSHFIPARYLKQSERIVFGN